MTAAQFEHPLEPDRLPSMSMDQSVNDSLRHTDSDVELAIPNVKSIQLSAEDVDAAGGQGPSGALLQIPILVQVILGSTTMALSKVMALRRGSIITLDQRLSEPVRLLVNGNEFARGTIVVIDEASGQLGVTLTEITPGTTSIKKSGQ